MVSTPTTRNRLELIGTGDKTNTWGSSLNSNVFTMVDEAMDGVALITVSGNVTLTSTNYTSDQARMRQLWLSGAGGFTITIPGVEKWYLVRNACSAAVTFSAGGATASVPASQSRIIFTNGTDVYVGDDGASLAYVDATFLKLTGGTMTGAITLAADAANNLHPVTLQQLNAAVLAAAAGNLPALSGNALKFLRVNTGETSVEWAAVDLTGFQPIDADLTAIAALTSAANKVPYATGAGTWAMADFSAAGRALVDDADNSAQRTTLGLGTIATQYANNVSITGGSITGITDLAVADGGTGASDAGTARTNLGLGTIATQAASSVSITGGSISGITDLAVADGGTGASDAATARTNLGLAIGTNVQAYDPELAALAGVTSAADALPYFTGSGTATTTTLTSFGRSLVDDTDAATARTTLGLGTIATQAANSVSITGGSVTGITDLAVADGGTGASDAGTARTNLGLGTIATQAANSVSISGGSITGITDLAVADGGTGASDAGTARTNLGLAIGTNVQAYDPELAALAGLTSAADKVPYFTGSATAALADFTAAGRALVDDADATAQRTTLGLGTIATQASSSVSITGGSITGITDLAVADGGTGSSTAAGAATNLGLGTGDSPQFTAVNLGHATDTTLTRVSAGVVAIEGAQVATLSAAQTFTAAQTINPSATGSRLYVGPGYNGGVAINAGDSELDVAAWTGKPALRLSRHNVNAWLLGVESDGRLNFTQNGSSAFQVGGNTVYTSANLPGTAITWTAAQTFTASPVKIGDGTDTVAMTGTSPLLKVQGASFSTGILARRDGFAEVGLKSDSAGNVGTWTNHPVNMIVNGSSVAQFPTGGGMTIGGNTVYHGGNLTSTGLTWGATQWFGGGFNHGPKHTNPFWAWINNSGTRNGYIMFADAGDTFFVNETGGSFGFSNSTSNANLIVNGNTVYHSGNLPGTAITWTAAQTLQSANLVLSNANISGATTGTAYTVGANPQASITSGGYVQLWGSTSANPGNVTLGNSTQTLTMNGAGSFTYNTYSIYHAGNLPGTAITWTAAQTFNGNATYSKSAPRILLNDTSGSADASLQFQSNGSNKWLVGKGAASGGQNYEFYSYTSASTALSILDANGAVEIGSTLKARIAASSETSGTLTSASANKTIQLTGNITINNSVFAAGDVVVVYAGAASRTITAGTISTMRLDGTATTGSRTVAAYGMASIFFVSATECVVSGGSVT